MGGRVEGGRRRVGDGDHQEKRQAATSSRSGSTTMTSMPASVLPPSRSRWGRMRSSQPGSHQLARPSEAHRRRHEHHAHERGVEEHGDGEADAEQLAVGVVAEDEGTEHADHDQRGGGDHPGGARQAARPRLRGCRRSRTYSSRTRDRRKTS